MKIRLRLYTLKNIVIFVRKIAILLQLYRAFEDTCNARFAKDERGSVSGASTSRHRQRELA